jgi:hypothetical protein
MANIDRVYREHPIPCTAFENGQLGSPLNRMKQSALIVLMLDLL